MDIKDSSLNRYKPRASSVNTRSSSIASYESSQNIHNTSEEHAQKQIQLKQGQQIKGEIVDLRSDSVTISIAGGKQLLTAKLANDLPLVIGQQATFLVSEDNQDQITLKYMPPTQSAMEMQTADKALIAANLPTSERNRMIVTELIKHNMPVDKQSLINTLRLILSNPSANPITLILMQKNHIPVTGENIAQFLAHQQGTASLSGDLDALTKQIFDLLNHSHTSESQQLSIHHELLGIVADGASGNTEPLGELPLQKVLSENGVNQVQSLLAKEIQEQLYTDEQPSTNNIHATDINNPPSSIPIPIIQESTQGKLLDTTPAILANLWSKYGGLKENGISLQQVLTMDEITQLKEYVTPLLSDEGNTLINSEKITTKQFINIIQKELPGKSTSLLMPLLQSSEYQKIVKNELLQKWSLTPEQLEESNHISDFYQNLAEDVTNLRKVLENNPNQKDLESVKETAKDIQNNLQFVKHLNDMFTYLPLPLSFKDQQGQGELYVFTKKKNLTPENKNMSVMLHLTMEHLGDINVFLQMNHNNVTSKFYMEDKEAYTLVKDHLSVLSNQLEQRGFTFTGEVNSSYEPLNFTKDFIDANGEDVNLSHYNFDIRA